MDTVYYIFYIIGGQIVIFLIPSILSFFSLKLMKKYISNSKLLLLAIVPTCVFSLFIKARVPYYSINILIFIFLFNRLNFKQLVLYLRVK